VRHNSSAQSGADGPLGGHLKMRERKKKLDPGGRRRWRFQVHQPEREIQLLVRREFQRLGRDFDVVFPARLRREMGHLYT
jgi:hypothetical protein